MKGWAIVVACLLIVFSTGVRGRAAGTQEREARASARALPTGGLQLDIEPRRARVFVDGEYVGLVDTFRQYYHHLDLPAGPHRIEVFESGYLPLIFGVMIVPDRTTTYRSTLETAASGIIY